MLSTLTPAIVLKPILDRLVIREHLKQFDYADSSINYELPPNPSCLVKFIIP